MKLKLDENGNAVLKDGHPVYVYPDGKEAAFDAAQPVSKIAQLNGEAKGHRERAEAAETKLKLFDGLDDAEAARKALETVANLDAGKLVQAGKVEEIKAAAKKAAEDQLAAISKTHTIELSKRDDQIKTLTGQIQTELIGGSFNRSKFISEKFIVPADIVQAKFGNNFKIEEGKVVAYDSAGNKIYSRTRHGEVANFDEALDTLVEAYPGKDSILKGNVKDGGGAGNGGSGGGKKALKLAEFSALAPALRAKHMADGGTLLPD